MNDNLTARQKAWFASIIAGLERDTGKSLAAWVDIVRTCPETRQRAQLAWLKTNFGLGQNQGMQIINAAFPPEQGGWDDPVTLRATVWQDASSLALLTAVEAVVLTLPDVVPTQRRSFTAWSRAVQFAAMKPVKGGHALLGLAITPDTAPGLSAAKKESWSERLKSTRLLTSPDEARDLLPQLRAAWEGA